jgi:hypothetical protein
MKPLEYRATFEIRAMVDTEYAAGTITKVPEVNFEKQFRGGRTGPPDASSNARPAARFFRS